MGPNYKKQDREQILAYLKAHPISSVEAIMEESGAEPVRVYPILFELNQEKIIRVLEETGWGAPLRVELSEQEP